MVAITSGSVVGKQAFLTTPRFVFAIHCNGDVSQGNEKVFFTGAKEVAKDSHSLLWRTGMCMFVEFQKGHLKTLSKKINFSRTGHIAKAYGVMREGSGYR